jgi:DNA-binding transcriptional MerR regulator
MKKFYYTIGEVSNLLEIKPHVIRYWETEFAQLKPRKEHGRNRQFTEEHIDLLRRIKDMLYNQKFTIDGARQRLKQMKKNQEQIELDLFIPSAEKPTDPISQAAIQRISNADKAQLMSDLIEIKKQVIDLKNRLKTLHRRDS